MTADLEAWSAWLEVSPASLFIQSNAWVIPVTQSVHIMTLAVIMTTMTMLNVRLIGVVGRAQSLSVSRKRFLPLLWRLLPVAALTGTVLIVGEPRRELLSAYFWAKMAMLVTVVGLTLLVAPLLEDKPLGDLAGDRRLLIRAVGTLSLLLWLAIIFCGRWIAYG
jgi:hypothetical protein